MRLSISALSAKEKRERQKIKLELYVNYVS